MRIEDKRRVTFQLRLAAPQPTGWPEVPVLLAILEAPPGFEPGMEVLQTYQDSQSSCLVLCSGIWSSLVLRGVWALLLSNCSRVPRQVRSLGITAWPTPPSEGYPAVPAVKRTNRRPRQVSGDLTGPAVPTDAPDHQPAPIGISERARSPPQRTRFSAIKQVRGAALLTITQWENE
jgi:hypothetical protein